MNQDQSEQKGIRKGFIMKKAKTVSPIRTAKKK